MSRDVSHGIINDMLLNVMPSTYCRAATCLASSKPWYGRAWKDKLAAGFTNSASINGDKGSTIAYLVTLAMQHGMLWVGTGMLPSNAKTAERNDVNWLAGSAGALAQSPSDASVEEMLPGDLDTAQLFGARVAAQAQRLRG